VADRRASVIERTVSNDREKRREGERSRSKVKIQDNDVIGVVKGRAPGISTH